MNSRRIRVLEKELPGHRESVPLLAVFEGSDLAVADIVNKFEALIVAGGDLVRRRGRRRRG